MEEKLVPTSEIRFVLEQYIKAGVGELDRAKLPQLLELKYNAIRGDVVELGSITEIFIYRVSASQTLLTTRG